MKTKPISVRLNDNEIKSVYKVVKKQRKWDKEITRHKYMYETIMADVTSRLLAESLGE